MISWFIHKQYSSSTQKHARKLNTLILEYTAHECKVTSELYYTYMHAYMHAYNVHSCMYNLLQVLGMSLLKQKTLKP